MKADQEVLVTVDVWWKPNHPQRIVILFILFAFSTTIVFVPDIQDNSAMILAMLVIGTLVSTAAYFVTKVFFTFCYHHRLVSVIFNFMFILIYIYMHTHIYMLNIFIYL